MIFLIASEVKTHFVDRITWPYVNDGARLVLRTVYSGKYSGTIQGDLLPNSDVWYYSLPITAVKACVAA